MSQSLRLKSWHDIFFMIVQLGTTVEKVRKYWFVVFLYVILVGCTPIVEDNYADQDLFTDSGIVVQVSNKIDHRLTTKLFNPESGIDTKGTPPKAIIDFAQTLIGIPYKYASSNPKEGFDCSGFITYVFNHFDIAVPRSSKDFGEVGEVVRKEDAKPGDLILFTGTNAVDRTIGHMGIVTFNSPDTLLFIHSTSGKLNSVTVTPFSEYYQSRFVKIIRVFEENNRVSVSP